MSLFLRVRVRYYLELRTQRKRLTALSGAQRQIIIIIDLISNALYI